MAVSFTGKKIAMFGDSIIENFGIPEELADRTGATVYNLGFGGCRMAPLIINPAISKANVYKNEMSMTAMATSIFQKNYDSLIVAGNKLNSEFGDDNRSQISTIANTINWDTIDIIWIDFGTNDFGMGVPLGTTSTNTTTRFHGAVKWVISRMQSQCKTSQIYFSTPKWRSAAGSPGDASFTKNGEGCLVSDYADVIRYWCAYYGLPVCDLNATLGVNKFNEEYYLLDGVHPTARGVDRIVDRMESFLRYHYV